MPPQAHFHINNTEMRKNDQRRKVEDTLRRTPSPLERVGVRPGQEGVTWKA